MKIINLTLLLLLLLTSCQRDDLKDLGSQEKPNKYDFSAIDSTKNLKGLFTYDKNLRDAYLGQYNKASLLEMTKKETPLVRAYSYWALMSFEEYLTPELLSKLIKDDGDMFRMVDCGLDDGRLHVNQTVFNLVYFENMENPDQKNLLDSLVVFTPTESLVKNYLMKYVDVDEKFYDKIREDALVDTQYIFLNYISHFQKETDIPMFRSFLDKRPLIHSFGVKFLSKYKREEDIPDLHIFFEEYNYDYRFYEVAAIFPHKSFYPILKAHYENFKKRKFENMSSGFLTPFLINNENDNEVIYKEIIQSNSTDAHLALWVFLDFKKPDNHLEYLVELKKIYQNKTLYQLTNDWADEKLRRRILQQELERDSIERDRIENQNE